MKFIYFIILSILIPSGLHAQQSNQGFINVDKMSNVMTIQPIDNFTEKKTPLVSYILENAITGSVFLTNGKLIKSYKVNYDAYSRTFDLFTKSGVKDIEYTKIDSVVIVEEWDGTDRYKRKFIKNQQVEAIAYMGMLEEVFKGDNLEVYLIYSTDFIKANYNPQFDTGSKEDQLLQVREIVFLYKGQQPVRNRLTKKNLLKQLGYKKELNAFINQKELDINDVYHLKDIVRYASSISSEY